MASPMTDDAEVGCGNFPDEPATSRWEYLIGCDADNMCLSRPET